MKKKLMMLLLLCATMVPVAAQDEKSHILIYKLDGTTDTLLLNNVRDIYHSRRDANGVQQPEISTLRLRTVGTERVYPLKEIDYVVMPKSGRVISFMGTTSTDEDNGGGQKAPRRTSVNSDDFLDATLPVNYHWVTGDFIYLSTGDKSENVRINGDSRAGSFTFRSDSLTADTYVVYYPGTKATAYNKVQIPVLQEQTVPNNSDHLGVSGDCGTATAFRQANSNYSFNLDHKSAVLCFIPRVDSLETLRLRQIAVKSTDGKMLAGTYTLSPEGMALVTETGSDTLTLKTSDFLLPHNKQKPANADWEHIPQDTVASYMVIAPQSERTPLKVYYRVYDTKSELDTVIIKSSTLKKVEGATVYPITHIIPVRTFFTAFTDSCQWSLGNPATLYGSVNLPITHYGFIWGYNKNLTFDTKEAQISLDDYPTLTFNGQAISDVKQQAYYYRAYAQEGDKTWFGKVKKFGLEREIINMGTSVRWSSINMGAVTAEDQGGFYAWGELNSKSQFSLANYQYYDTGTRTYTDIGSNIVGNPQYDAVTALWRGCWRMPTIDEMQELKNKCDWSNVTRTDEDGNEVAGLLVKNRNQLENPDSTLFIPKSGNFDGTTHYSVGSYADMWSGNNYNDANAYYQANNGGMGSFNKYRGLTIRPVFESNIETSDNKYLFIRTDSISYSDDHTSANMYGTTRGLDDAVTSLTQGFVIGTENNVELGSGDVLKVTLSQSAEDNGSYHLLLSKEQMNTLDITRTYYVRAYLTYSGNTWYGDPKEMKAMTITTDSTNWKVGRYEARLCGAVTGVTAAVKPDTELGFVVGTAAEVTLETEGRIKIKCDSTVNGKFVCDFENIDFKQYYYRAYVKVGERIAYGDPKMLGLEFVDLGLPSGLKWANINVGSQTPMDNGDPYSWGETTTKTSFSNNVNNSAYGTDIGGTIHDAAQVNWQGPWRMPSKSDVEELISNCNWQKVTLYGKEGHLLTSKINGNTIFIPFTGHWYNGSYHYDYTWRYLLWTSTWSRDNRAWYFDNYPSNNPSPKMEHEDVHGYGFYVRPVALVNDTLDDRSMIQMTTDSVKWEVGQATAKLYGYLLGLRYNSKATESGFAYSTDHISDTATNETDGVYYLKTNEGELYNVASGVMEATVPEVADETVYYYRAYVKVDGKYYFANEREFGRRSVDLGLSSGLLWSNINVGSSSPDDSGDYYAWGETEPKRNYTSATYTFNENIDDISGSAHDVAHVDWGGIWRMPTKEDLEELLTSCTWTEINRYGVDMYKVTGPSGDSIFVAKSGSMSNTTLSNYGTWASLWTSTLNTPDNVDNDNAFGSAIYGSSSSVDAVARHLGFIVRPVGRYNYTLDDGTRIYLTTDSTNWQVGERNVRLCGAVAGLGNTTATLGFVVGNSADPADLEVGKTNVSDITAAALEADNTFRGTLTYDKDTTYYYRAYVEVDGQIYYGNVRRYGLELVDMGNGIKWASLNVGAQISSDAGNRYAWGETTTKSSYTQSTYKYYSNGYEIIGSDISATRFDVAKSVWGGEWRMPTQAEMNALADTDNFDWQWGSEDGVSGYTVTSHETGKSIFLPAAGYQENAFVQQLGSECFYWTSTLDNDGYSNALHGTSSAATIDSRLRYIGMSVRPVTTAGANEGGGGDITGGHNQGGSQQTGGEGNGNGNAGSGNTGGTITGN